jgi:hypothetical protein
MKQLLLIGTALLALTGVANSAIPAHRNLKVVCGDFTLHVVSADRTNNILRLDVVDKNEDGTALTVKYGRGGMTWGKWFKEGDTIDFPERWQGNKLSWIIRSGDNSVSQTLQIDGAKGTFTIRATAQLGAATIHPCRVEKNEWSP